MTAAVPGEAPQGRVERGPSPQEDHGPAWDAKDEFQQNQRLARFLFWLIVPFFVFAPIDIGIGVVFDDPRSLALGLLLAFLAPALLLARSQALRGRQKRAVAVTIACLMVPATLIVFLRPHLYPVLAVGCLLAVAVALPFTSTATLRRVGFVAWANATLILVLGRFVLPATAASETSALLAAINVAAFSIVIGLVILMFWYFSGRLRETLAETRIAHAALAATHDQLQTVDRMRAQFMNTAAHEMYTPLTPIQIQLYMLRNRNAANLTEEQRASLEMVQRNFTRLTQLAGDLMDTARAEAGRFPLQRELTPLHEIAQEAVTSFQPLAAKQGVSLSAFLEPGPLLEVDAHRIRQVIDNLLANSIKFSRRGGHIVLETHSTADQAQVTIRDDGVGIDPAEIGKLFQPFVRVHSVDLAVPGTGLGLFIARGIVEAHGGKVWAQSLGLGKGATFAFALPRPPRAAEPATASAGQGDSALGIRPEPALYPT